MRAESTLGSKLNFPLMAGMARPPRSRAFIFSTLEKVSVRSGFSAGPSATEMVPLSNTMWQQSSSPSFLAPNWTVAWTFSNCLWSFGSSSSSTWMVGKAALKKSLAVMMSWGEADIGGSLLSDWARLTRRPSSHPPQTPCPAWSGPGPRCRWRPGRSRRTGPRRSRWRQRCRRCRAF